MTSAAYSARGARNNECTSIDSAQGRVLLLIFTPYQRDKSNTGQFACADHCARRQRPAVRGGVFTHTCEAAHS